MNSTLWAIPAMFIPQTGKPPGVESYIAKIAQSVEFIDKKVNPGGLFDDPNSLFHL